MDVHEHLFVFLCCVHLRSFTLGNVREQFMNTFISLTNEHEQEISFVNSS
ncbi:hypothetical protein Hanom_Chr14g01308551 [Helianthus anomalus]